VTLTLTSQLSLESSEKSSESQSENGGSGPWLGGHGQSSLSRQLGDCEVGLQVVLDPGKRLSRASGQL
jgi:hypothetical protein